MSQRNRNLPHNAERREDQISGPVVDSIMIAPWSQGALRMPGEYSTGSRPPGHQVKITATNRERCDYETCQLGEPARYSVIVKVWNYNDSPAFADLVLHG